MNVEEVVKVAVEDVRVAQFLYEERVCIERRDDIRDDPLTAIDGPALPGQVRSARIVQRVSSMIEVEASL